LALRDEREGGLAAMGRGQKAQGWAAVGVGQNKFFGGKEKNAGPSRPASGAA